MSEKKGGILKHFSIIGGGTLINMILGVFTTPIITRIVDPVDYGKLSIFTMYSGIALMVLCLGLDQAMVRYYYESEKEEYKRALLFRCIKLPIVSSIFVSVVIIIVSALDVITFEFGTFYMILLCVYTIIQLIYRFSLLLLRLAYKTKLYSILNVLHKLVYIVISLPLIFIAYTNDLLSLIIATMMSGIICMMVSIVFQKNIWNLRNNDAKQCHISQREILKYGYPYIFSMGITTLFQAADKIFLNKFCSYGEVGIYASTMTLVSIFGIIQSTFNSLWTPLAVEHYSKDKNDKKFYQKGNQAITVVMFFIGLSLILCKDLFAVLLGEKYREAAYILPFLIFNPIMYTVSETTVSGLVFMKKSKLQVVVAFGACISNIVGNAVLVPRLGCQGAAISTGLSYIIFFALRTYFSNRYFYVDYKLLRYYALTFVTALYALYNTFISFNFFTVVGYILCLVILLTLYKDTVQWGIRYGCHSLKLHLKK